MKKRTCTRLALCLIALGTVATTAAAQLSQYRPAGEITEVETPDREEMKDRIARAPWTWGKARVQPRLGLGSAEYSDNIFDASVDSETESELRASAHAGLEIFLPVSTDSVLAVFARPSYDWWQNNGEFSRLNWNYGAAAFGYFNRASLQVSARRTEVEENLNNEVRIPVTTQSDRIGLDGKVEVAGPWQVFGSVATIQTRYPEAEKLGDRIAGLPLLERDEDVVSAGVGYEIPGRFEAGVGWRRTETSFVDDPLGRSSSGEYPFIMLSVPGNRLQLRAEVGQRLLEFEQGSGLSETEETVGRASITFELGDRTHLDVYGFGDIVYSALDPSAYFSSTVTGVSLGWGREFKVRLFAESGEDDYASSGGLNAGRQDSGESYGVAVQLPLKWGLIAEFGYYDTTIDSNLDGFDRAGSGIRTSIRLDLPDFPF